MVRVVEFSVKHHESFDLVSQYRCQSGLGPKVSQWYQCAWRPQVSPLRFWSFKTPTKYSWTLVKESRWALSYDHVSFSLFSSGAFVEYSLPYLAHGRRMLVLDLVLPPHSRQIWTLWRLGRCRCRFHCRCHCHCCVGLDPRIWLLEQEHGRVQPGRGDKPKAAWSQKQKHLKRYSRIRSSRSLGDFKARVRRHWWSS